MTDLPARAARAADELRARFGVELSGVWAAPGRVNLIGEHTDYNHGLVLPVAIGRETVVAVAGRDDDVVRAASLQEPGLIETRIGAVSASDASSWGRYVAGVLWALREHGRDVHGIDVVVNSDVPVGAGLSSSAALLCATALAVMDLTGATIDRMTLALAAQRAECEVVGAPVGVMDHVASLFGRRRHAVFLDCATMDVQQVPLDLEAAGLVLLVIDTRVRHNHATGGYRQRRQECEQAAAELGVATLRDATPDDVARLADVLRRRARHVVTENERVAETVTRLSATGPRSIGDLLTASHISLRDDFEVSTRELNLVVEGALAAGALGARMTGGGFGGCAIALVPADRLDAVRSGVLNALRGTALREPDMFVVDAADGARRVR